MTQLFDILFNISMRVNTISPLGPNGTHAAMVWLFCPSDFHDTNAQVHYSSPDHRTAVETGFNLMNGLDLQQIHQKLDSINVSSILGISDLQL